MKHFVFAMVLLAGSVLAAEEVKDFGRDRLNNSPRHGDWVDIKSGARSIKAFVVYPERKDKAPAVLVVSEIFGLTDWVRSLCDELAENGVIAIAPDLHGGQKFEDLDGARKATSALPQEQVKADLDERRIMRSRKFLRAMVRSRCADSVGAEALRSRMRMKILN